MSITEQELPAHPEGIPVCAADPIKSFTFNMDRLPATLKEVDELLEKLQSQFDAQEVAGIIEGKNLLSTCLSVTHDRTDLKRFARALYLAADLIGPIDELIMLRDFINAAQQRPAMVAWAFGDFSDWPDDLDSFESPLA